MLNNVDQVLEEELLQICEKETAGDAKKTVGYESVLAAKKRFFIINHVKQHKETQDKSQHFGWIERRAEHGHPLVLDILASISVDLNLFSQGKGRNREEEMVEVK
jgi:hypothetical protein